MVDELQTWANWAQIASLAIAVSSLMVSILMWRWKRPSDVIERIRPWAPKVLIGIGLVSLGFFLKAPVTRLFIGNDVDERNALQLSSMPFTAASWVASEKPDEVGWTHFTLIHGAGNQGYKLDYTLPLTSTEYSGGGITFSFSEPQDLADYEFVEISITFGCYEARCNFDMRDISEAIGSVGLGLNSQYGEDIQVRTSGMTQIVVIPLASYYGSINRKVVQDMGFSVSTESSRNYHHFTINEVRFLENMEGQ